MNSQVTSYRLIWEPMARRGEVAFFTEESQGPIKIPIVSAEEFAAITAVFRTCPVFWNGRYFTTGEGFGPQLTDMDQFDLFTFEVDSNAQRIINVCEQEWPSNKDDCNNFVRAVASTLGVSMEGDANKIVDTIRGPGWELLSNGNDAKQAADAGKFVVAGLKGGEQETPSVHGHVVVVVSGPLGNGHYPTAYWGKLGGVGEKFKTINYAWRAGDRDKVTYAAKNV